MKYRLGLAMLIPLLVMGLAACGGSKNHGSTKTGSSMSPEQRKQLGVKFAACMREHGIDMPDPGPGAGPGAANQPPDKIDAAMQACRQYMPNGGDLSTPNPQQIEQQRKYARCMRDHGISDFPDPDAQGRFEPSQNSAVNPSDPKFAAADKACSQLRPQGGGVGP
jgi:hypothetical protein